jgi:hypothetical protein
MSLNRLLARHVRRAALTLCAAAVLSACGGGDRAEPYVPTQLQVYGDELSLIDDSVTLDATNTVTGAPTSSTAGNGVKYTVNGFNSTTGVLDCAVNPIWVQILAANLGMAFKECVGTYTSYAAHNNAKVGAKTYDVIPQLAALRATNPGRSTLVTVLVGTYDVKELYAEVKAGTLSLADALTQAQQRGKDLGAEITRVTEASIGIIVATVPDLGQSPYALLPANGNDAAAITQLTNAFNTQMLLGIPGDGHKVGLVYGRPVGLDLNGNPTSTYTNAAVCADTNLPPKCTTSTLVSGGDISTWIWAADVYPTPLTHTKLGNNASTLARNTLAPGQ